MRATPPEAELLLPAAPFGVPRSIRRSDRLFDDANNERRIPAEAPTSLRH